MAFARDVPPRRLSGLPPQLGALIADQALAASRRLPSMTDAKHFYQNALAERINGILKDEYNLNQTSPTVKGAQQACRQKSGLYAGRATTTRN